jgi:hypothetical protein
LYRPPARVSAPKFRVDVAAAFKDFGRAGIKRPPLG